MIWNQLILSRVVCGNIVVCESRIDILPVFVHKPLGAVDKDVVELRCSIRGIVEMLLTDLSTCFIMSKLKYICCYSAPFVSFLHLGLHMLGMGY